ncbi:MAG: LCP family protein [Clostridia bacterium]
MARRGSSNQDDYKEKKTNKKKITKNIFFRIIFVVYVLLTIVFFGYIVSINMVPTKYLVILAVIILGITAGLSIGILRPKKKKAINIVCTLTACCILAVYGTAYYYLGNALNFIGTMSNINEETEEYYVVALKDSKFNKIEDIKGKELYMFEIADGFKDVQTEISSKVKVNFKKEDNLDTLSSNLLNKKVDVILVGSVQYSMITDEKENFKSKTKIIYTATHKIKENKPEEIKDNKSKYTIENGVFNVYISGIDTDGRISNVSRSDANIVATINTKTNEVLLTSIPRDYYVVLHSKKAKDKLTHSGIYGINETITTVQDLLGIDINYYVRVNFTTVIKVVDAIGGVDVNSDVAFSSVGYSYKKGMNHLNGKQALAFSRERYSFAGGDRQRGKNQQKVIEAIIKKLTSSTTVLTKYTNILNSLSSSFQTNVEQKDISSLVKMQLDTMPSWKISNMSLDGTGANLTTYSAGSQKLYVMIPDQNTVKEAKSKIDSILDGK